MNYHIIVLVAPLISSFCFCSETGDSEFRTFGGISRRDRTSTTTSTTARSVIIEKKIEDEEPKEIPIPAQNEKANEKPKEGRAIAEDRTFGRDGMKNILLGGVIVAVVNIAPVILSGLKTVVNLALPILGLVLFRKHRSFRYFDDFMDMFEEYTNDNENEDEFEQDKEVVNNEEYVPPQNYPYANYDYNYYNTNPYRAYGY